MSSAPPASSARPPRGTRGKEAVLAFLAVFYFVIATNTQSGWLFLLSAFLLGLLAICYLPPRRAADQILLQREMLSSPRRDDPLLLRLCLSNRGSGVVREVLVIEPAQPWAREPAEFRWVVPRLAPGQSLCTEFSLLPERRGEHVWNGSTLRFGAPFGLFSVLRSSPDSEPFLVYPRLLSLPPRRQRTRLAGILSEFTSPRSRGDSRSLRSLREYRAGDDLRRVHWKSSAKTGGSTLLVREHHAPSRQLSLLLLDTSARNQEADGQVECFEKAVSLAASLLRSAQRAGTRATLLLMGPSGEWLHLTRWEEQYPALARVERHPSQPFREWLTQAAAALEQFPEARTGAHPFLIAAASDPEDLGRSPLEQLPQATCLLVAPPASAGLFDEARLTVVDIEDGHAREALEVV